MPREVTKRFIRTRRRSPASCAAGSFRTIRRGRDLVVICCPRGHWNKRTRRCRVGTLAQSVLKRRR